MLGYLSLCDAQAVTDSSLPDDEYKILVQKTNSILASSEGTQDWTEVGNLLSRIDLNTIGNEKRKEVIGAIGRLWKRSQGEGVEKYVKDPLVEDEDRQKVQIEGDLLQSLTRPKSPSVEQKMERYLDESRILGCFVGKEREEVRQAMEMGLKEFVRHKGQWPGRDTLRVKEQFFWNVYYRTHIDDSAIKHIQFLFATTTLLNWQEFSTFYSPYLQGVLPRDKRSLMQSLFTIYQAFPEDNEARAQFMAFCSPYLQGVLSCDKSSRIQSLFTIYQAFPEDNEARAQFMAFCEPYFQEKDPLRRFISPAEKPSIMINLLPIYQAFPNERAREEFIDFFRPYRGQKLFHTLSLMKDLLPIYQAFPNEATRAGFIDFCKPYVFMVRSNRYNLSIIQVLLSIYQTDLLRENFHLYMQPCLELRLSEDIFEGLISTYLPRTYLCYERALAALGAETAPDLARVQALFETQLQNSQPALWAADPFLQQVRAEQDVANVHEFDALYELDRGAFFTWCQNKGYQSKVSDTKRTIYNGDKSLKDYQTNQEVEDFINYLDELSRRAEPFKLDGKTIAAPEVVSILKQMLGLEPKKFTTSGGFAPYLGHSMYYADPDSPKGDEMLGRVWFMMKKLGQDKLGRVNTIPDRRVML